MHSPSLVTRHLGPRRVLALAAITASLLLVGAGCGKKPPQDRQVPSPSAANPAPAPSERPVPSPGPAVSLCANPYFALSRGMRVDYESTVAGKVSTYSMVVTDATATSAKLSYEYPNTTYVFVQDIVCENGSVTTTSFMNFAGANSSMKTETKRVEGELMPKDVHAGSTWTASYESVATLAGLPEGVAAQTMTLSVASQSKAIGEESVTVPAGTFTAMKVESTSTTTSTISGAPATSPTVTTTQQWWVKGVGLVKSATEGKSGTTVTVATKVTR
ncbi:MAG TPA: hypothetical protein VL500_03350 [Candidatus Eisenbacteria bacterium]|nr:hypothetical protein [Candidatus Eisenbacteria bacterium]